MKRFFTSISLMMLAVMAFSQVTITSDNVAAIGATVKQANDTIFESAAFLDVTGNADFDFSGLQNHVESSLNFIDVAGTPFEDVYPTANICAVQDSGFYVYLRNDMNALTLIGTAGEFDLGFDTLDLTINFNPAQILLNFPATYGDSYNYVTSNAIVVPGSILGQPAIDSFALRTTSSVSATIDAYGMVTTPLGTYDCIRVREEIIAFDTTQAKLFGIWTTVDAADVGDTTYTHSFWTNANGLGFPLVQLDVDNTGTVVNKTWLSDFTTSTNDVFEAVAFDVFPNPAVEYIQLQMEESFDGNIQITDFNGRNILNQPFSGYSTHLDVAAYPAGQYLLSLINQEGKLIGFKLFNKSK
ncbi:MAG: T9SS type A sorting domain-containing protein [Saprospiraceae bacterium]|nr:T9SS type A sorting domain-containing protein [Saprospiraceae bacterium]